jgi:ubiquinone/menaquinone biosynthesis C-methylase UbiE
MRKHRLLAVLVVLLVVTAVGCAGLKRFAYSGFGRDRWQHPEQVIGSLGIQTGDRVADLGSGGGYFTFRLADAVGPDGKVYAVDVDPGMIRHLEERASKEGYSNVEVVLAQYDDPLLPEPGVDLIFTCNTYHHLEDRIAYFDRARQYLRPGGRVAIVEHRPGGWLQWIFPHSTPSEVIRTEMEAAGYQFQNEHSFLPRQNFLVFTLRPMHARVTDSDWLPGG